MKCKLFSVFLIYCSPKEFLAAQITHIFQICSFYVIFTPNLKECQKCNEVNLYIILLKEILPSIILFPISSFLLNENFNNM